MQWVETPVLLLHQRSWQYPVRISVPDAELTYLRPIFELLNKLSHPVFCSKLLMHHQTMFNTYKLTDFFTLRFAFPSVLQVKWNFILILALASNSLSVISVCVVSVCVVSDCNLH